MKNIGSSKGIIKNKNEKNADWEGKSTSDKEQLCQIYETFATV